LRRKTLEESSNMSIQVLGISGSPVKNSNTDRIVQAILESSGLEYKFVKLSTKKIGPCRACKKCVPDNICKVNDDFQALAEKIKTAKALVIGAYCPYGMIDGFTKAFLERLWSMRHVNNLNRGKLVTTAITGISFTNVILANMQIARELIMERMEIVGQISFRGNVPCLTCGQGSTCEMSGVPALFGKEAPASAERCIHVEDQKRAWGKIGRLGRLIGERVRGNDGAKARRTSSRLSKLVVMVPLLFAEAVLARAWTSLTQKRHR
jgi:NAD(P)H-dependent FMN reductase